MRLHSHRLETPCKLNTTNNVLDPFLLERRLLPKIWGGSALQDELGIVVDGAEVFGTTEQQSGQPVPIGDQPLPIGDQPLAIGESWELFDRPDGSSKLRGTEMTLADLLRKDPEAIVGRGVRLGHNGTFPLLLKFLDAHQGLSLQVHPDDRQAKGDMGKNECCLILAVGDDARIVHGVVPGVDRDDFLAKWETPAVEPMLYSFAPKVGDLVHIPPGTPHSIGPGVVAFEVQQNSDQTYRFYDWGRGRATHAAEARDVVNLVANERPPIQRSTSLPDGGELLIATEHFVVRRYELARRIELATYGRYLTLTVLNGGGRLQWANGANESSLVLKKCDTVVVPACVSMVAVEPDGAIDFVACDPGTR
ncbi:MAG: mannose-6-phosphate isomerase [Candidatus Azotimanducaceae bacterium]